MELQELAPRFSASQTSIVAISADEAADSAEMVTELGLADIRVLTDPALGTIDAYGVRHEGKEIAVPSVFLIGQDGRVSFSYIGESMTDRPSSEELAEMAAALSQR